MADELSTIRVINNKYLNYSTTRGLSKLDASLPENASFQNKIKELISEEPASDFVTDRISEILDETQEYDDETDQRRLVDLEGFHSPSEVATRLIDEFESLPWEYKAFVSLPYEFSKWIAPALRNSKLQLSQDLCIRSPDDAFTSTFPDPPNHHPGKGLWGFGSLDTPSEWNSNCLYMEGGVTGFVGYYSNTMPIEEFKFAVRSFCGLALAKRLVRIRSVYYGSPRETKVVVFRNQGENWSPRRTHSFTEEVSQQLESLDIGKPFSDLDDEPRNHIIRHELQGIGAIFEDPDQNESLIRAAQWLFDSYCGKNNLLAFVQATVALEILLGDRSISDIMGLGELLRNRCAYLIGQTRTQREEILSDFKRIYDTRSKIVHRGKNRLTVSEQDDLWTLRWMCARVIQEELMLIMNEKEAT